MREQPGASVAELDSIDAWITGGVRLDLLTRPEPIDHDYTFSVAQNAAIVRTRFAEYEQFGALLKLTEGHFATHGVQPLHVIIKPDRKPRVVSDLSRNHNDHLEYEYFCYTTVSQAVERA